MRLLPPMVRLCLAFALGLASQASYAEGPAPGIPASEDKPGELKMGEIMQYVVSQKQGVIDCVKAQKKRDPGLSATLLMEWTISPTGAVSDARSAQAKPGEESLATCMSSLISSWRFPSSKLGKPRVDMPFKF